MQFTNSLQLQEGKIMMAFIARVGMALMRAHIVCCVQF